jgi:hypothetical protein
VKMNMNNCRKIVLCSAGLILLGFAPAFAQLSLTPRALGTGGAYIGIARGQEALFLNPANLALPDNPGWSLNVGQVSVGGIVLGASSTDFAKLMGLKDEDGAGNNQDFLRRIPENGLEMDMELRAPLFAMQAGPVAFGVSYAAVTQQKFSRDLADLFLNSYEEDRTDYSVGNTTGSYATFIDFAAAYGRQVGPVAVGVTGHYLHGRTVSRSRLFDPRFNRQNEPHIAVDYMEVLARGGKGFSLDAGAAYQPNRRLTLSGSVSNLIGAFWWSEDLWVRDLTLTENDFSDDPVTVAERFTGSERRMGEGSGTADAMALADVLYEGMRLPTTLRAGAAFGAWPGMRLGTSFHKNLRDGGLAGGWDQSVGIGVQQKLPLISLRAGYASDLSGGRMFSGGVSLAFLDIGAALIEGEKQGVSHSGAIITMGTGIRGRTKQ